MTSCPAFARSTTTTGDKLLTSSLKTIRADFLVDHDRVHATIVEAQAALDGWVAEYNTERPHQSCGGRPLGERFALAAQRPVIVDDQRAVEVAAPQPSAAPRPAGVSRWVDVHGRIRLAGVTYAVGATYVGEPVEAVVIDGLVEIWHAGVLVASHAQRLKPDQKDRAARAPVQQRRARDATTGLTVTRLVDASGAVSFAGTIYRAGHAWRHTSVQVSIVGGSVQIAKDGRVIRVHPIRHDQTRELGAFANLHGRLCPTLTA